MSKRQDGSRWAICGLGDGGCNAVLAKAKVFSEVLESAQACRQDRYVQELSRAVRFVFINTNYTSLDYHKDSALSIFAKWPHVTVDKFELGPETTLGQGTGTVESTGLEAAEESITRGKLPEFLSQLGIEGIDLNTAFGSGGSGLGAAFPIIQHCREAHRLLTLPSITAASMERKEISFARAKVIAEKLGQLDRAGVAYSLLRTTHLYGRKDTKAQAYARMDRLQALASFGILKVLAQRTSYDPNDALRQLYCNAQKKEMGKRWLMAGETLKLSRANRLNTDGWKEVVERLLQTHVFQFDLKNIGGAMVAFEHAGLSGEAQSNFMNALYAVVNDRAGSEGNENFHPKEVDLASADPEEVTVRIWAAEYTGVPLVKDIPRLKWLPPVQFTIHVPEGAAAGAEEPVEEVAALVPVPKGFQPTHPWKTLEDLLVAAVHANPEALWVLDSGLPQVLKEQDVTYREDDQTITCKVIKFPITGPQAGEQVLSMAPLLYDAKRRLQDGRYSDTWTAFLVGSLESFLTKNQVALVRYLPVTAGYLEITPDTSPEEIKGNPTFDRWVKSRDPRALCALGGLYLRKTFGELVEMYVELPQETGKLTRFMTGLGGAVGINRAQLLPPSISAPISTPAPLPEAPPEAQAVGRRFLRPSQWLGLLRKQESVVPVSDGTDYTSTSTNGHIKVGVSGLPPTA